MKSAASCRPCATKKARFTRAKSLSAYAYVMSGRSEKELVVGGGVDGSEAEAGREGHCERSKKESGHWVRSKGAHSVAGDEAGGVWWLASRSEMETLGLSSGGVWKMSPKGALGIEAGGT